MSQRQTQEASTRQQEMTANQLHADYGSVETGDGVTFSSGNMLVNGTTQVPEQAQQWESSNGLSVYTTVAWIDPVTRIRRVSCNCPGWTLKKRGKLRRCKHTDDMMGIAMCGAKQINGRVTIHTITEAESVVPEFDGHPLRSIMLD